jgi:hypothetical protein
LASLSPELGGYSLGLTGASGLATLLGRVLSTYPNTPAFPRVALIVALAVNVWATVNVVLYTLHRIRVSVPHFSSRDNSSGIHKRVATSPEELDEGVSMPTKPGSQVLETHPVGAAEASMATIILGPFYATYVNSTLGKVVLIAGSLLLISIGCMFTKRMWPCRAQRPFPTPAWFPATVGVGSIAIGGANMGLLSPLLLVPLIISCAWLVALMPAVAATALIPARRRIEPPFRIFVLTAPVSLCAMVYSLTV